MLIALQTSKFGFSATLVSSSRIERMPESPMFQRHDIRLRSRTANDAIDEIIVWARMFGFSGLLQFQIDDNPIYTKIWVA